MTDWGYSTIGTNIDAQPVGWMSCNKFESNETDTITTIRLYCHTNSSSGKVKMAVFPDSGGVPYAEGRLCTSDEQTVGLSWEWVDFTVSFAAVDETDYWFGRFSDSVLYTRYDAGDTGQWKAMNNLTYDTPPTSWVNDWISDNKATLIVNPAAAATYIVSFECDYDANLTIT